MTQPKKPNRVLTDDELGVVSSGLLLPILSEQQEPMETIWAIAQPVPMPKVIVKQAHTQPHSDSDDEAADH